MAGTLYLSTKGAFHPDDDDTDSVTLDHPTMLISKTFWSFMKRPPEMSNLGKYYENGSDGAAALEIINENRNERARSDG